MHQKMVLSPQNAKQNERDNIEDRDRENFLRRQALRYDTDNMHNQKSNQEFLDENDALMKKRQFDKEIELMKQKEEDIMAQGEKDAMNMEKQANLEDIQNKKNLYKQTLLYQQAMNNHNKHNFGKMTYAGEFRLALIIPFYREKAQ